MTPHGLGTFALAVSLFAIAACGGIISPTSPSAIPARAGGLPSVLPPGGAVSGPRSQVIHGSVGPLRDGTPPCFASLYPCEVFDFSTVSEGSIEVVLTWDGAPRALMVQLYWAGEGLAHEDIAPSNGPSRIAFLRPRMEAAAYRIRVVSREPASAIPFTLEINY
jgi:hypothetical protein